MVDLRKLATPRERFEWLVSIWSVYTRSRIPDATSLGNVPEITRCLFNPLLPSIALHHDGTNSLVRPRTAVIHIEITGRNRRREEKSALTFPPYAVNPKVFCWVHKFKLRLRAKEREFLLSHYARDAHKPTSP